MLYYFRLKLTLFQLRVIFSLNERFVLKVNISNITCVLSFLTKGSQEKGNSGMQVKYGN